MDPLGAALTAVKLGAAPHLAPTKGAEVGTAQPKVCDRKATMVPGLSRQLKRTAEWRAMGKSLGSWLRADKDPEPTVAPLANPVTDRQPLATVPKGTNQTRVSTTMHTVNTSCGGGPGQTRFDYSDKRWLEGRWREEKDIEGPGAGTLITTVGLQVDGRWNDGVLKIRLLQSGSGTAVTLRKTVKPACYTPPRMMESSWEHTSGSGALGVGGLLVAYSS